MGRRLATPRTARALGVTIILLVLAAIAFSVADHGFRAGDGGSVVLVPGFGIVGFIVASRQPRNPMGWVLLAGALCLAVDDAASTYAVFDYRSHHGNLPLGRVAVLLQPGIPETRLIEFLTPKRPEIGQRSSPRTRPASSRRAPSAAARR